VRKGEVGEFCQVAYNFTNESISMYGKYACSITVSGHSLGGWLAQMVTFFIKCPDLYDGLLDESSGYEIRFNDGTPMKSLNLNLPKLSHHLHCVAFDSPGCEEV